MTFAKEATIALSSYCDKTQGYKSGSLTKMFSGKELKWGIKGSDL